MAPRFEELIDRHHDEIFSYLWRLLGKARHADVSLDAEDLVQEVFMRAYDAFLSLRPDSNHRAWLYKIATRCAFTKLRQTNTRRDKMANFANAAATHDISLPSEHWEKSLQAAVEALPAKQKACVTLRYFDDLDYPEIAEIVGCSAMSARANVYQAIRQLRNTLREDR